MSTIVIRKINQTIDDLIRKFRIKVIKHRIFQDVRRRKKFICKSIRIRIKKGKTARIGGRTVKFL